MIWGLVLRQDGKSAPRLYWTTSRGKKRAKEVYQPENFKLPDLFWSDLVEVLRLVVANYDAEFSAGRGQFMADRLAPFIERVKKLLATSSGQDRWSTNARVEVQFIQANALMTFGDQSGTGKPIEEAIVAYHTILQKLTRERAPLAWALVQHNLGSALVRLGERESSTQRLEAAVATYHTALEEWTRERAPLDWAMAQDSLGTALMRLGEREGGGQRLEAALSAYREALRERTRDRVPLDWATTQLNLGTALMVLGEREGGTVRLDEAVTAFHSTFEVHTPERAPLRWAMMQNDLGNALVVLGERKKDAKLVCDALGSHLNAWEVFSGGKHFQTFGALIRVKRDITVLQKVFGEAAWRSCLMEHEERLKYMAETHGW